MTAHLALRYARLDSVEVTGGDAVAVGESAVPLQLGERQSVQALLAALIVHSANDAAVVLAHATMEQPAAQEAAARAARDLHRSLPKDPVARFVLLMNDEARRLGLVDTVYRTPHGLDEPGAHSSAHDVLTLARLDMASPVFRELARATARDHPGTREPADEQHAAGRLRRPRRRQDRPHRRGRLEPGGERRARRHAAVRDPARSTERGAPRSRCRAPARLGLRSLRARQSRARRSGLRSLGPGPGRRSQGPLGRARSRASRCTSASCCRAA